MSTTANTKNIEIPVGFETVREEDFAAREKLTTARVALLLKASFFGNMATRLPLVNADAWLPTAATDGRFFYYNSKFINMLKVVGNFTTQYSTQTCDHHDRSDSFLRLDDSYDFFFLLVV